MPEPKPADLPFLRHAIRLSEQAMDRGNEPFGALLTLDGTMTHEAENTVCTESDPTRHAEMNLVSAAARELDRPSLERAVLYSSTEPCAMCAAAAFWVGVRHITYACSNEALAALAGKGLFVSCHEVLSKSSAPSVVEGPFLEEEAVAVHRRYWGAK